MCGDNLPEISLSKQDRRLVEMTWDYMKSEQEVFPVKLFTEVVSRSQQIRRVFGFYVCKSDDRSLAQENVRQAEQFYKFFDDLIAVRRLNGLYCAERCYQLGAMHVEYRHYGFHQSHLRVIADFMPQIFARCIIPKTDPAQIETSWCRFMAQVAGFMELGYIDAIKLQGNQLESDEGGKSVSSKWLPKSEVMSMAGTERSKRSDQNMSIKTETGSKASKVSERGKGTRSTTQAEMQQ